VRATIYTANIGGRDVAYPQVAQSDVDVEWVYYTDDPGLDVPEPWERRLVDRIDRHPNMAAKWWKTHPSPATVDGGYAIWVDASMEITNPLFASAAIGSLDGAPIAVWRHPRRACVYDEVDASLGAEAQGGRYATLPLREQAAAYRREGYPERAGLYACGTIVWTDDALLLGDAWWRECVRWGYQDQVSFPVVCWREGIKPATFRVPQIEPSLSLRRPYLANRWLRIHPHRPGTD
jgi:hypothetical protein